MTVRITGGMLIALILNMVYAKGIGVTQGAAAREAGSDMWLSTIFATFQGLLIMALVVAVCQRVPQLDVIQLSESLFGKLGAVVFGLVVFVFFFFAFGPIMITFVYHLKDYFLPEAPTIIIVCTALGVSIYGVYKGLEVMARMAYVGLFFIFLLNILLMLGSLSEFDVRNLLPVLDSGLWNTLRASRHNDTDWAMATMMASIILPCVKNKQKWNKTALIGIALGGLMVAMWPFLETAVLSAEVTGHYIVACMQLARSAHIGEFLHRYELIMVAFFATSALVQVMISIFCASVAASRIFRLKDYRPAVLPCTLILGAFGYWIVSDHIRAIRLLEQVWPMIALPIAMGLPAILYVSQLLLKRKDKIA
jgi:spore germination protein KB